MIKYLQILCLITLLSACTKPIVVKVFDFNAPISKSFNDNSNFFINRNIDIKNIRELWDESTPGSYSTGSTFTAYDSILFIHDLSGRLRALNIADGKKFGELKYNGSIEQTPIIIETFLHFFVNHEKESYSSFVTYDIVNGKELRAIDLPGKFTNEIVSIGKHIYSISDFGILYKFSQWGTIVWEKDLEILCYSNPTVDSNFLYIASVDGNVLKIDGESGKVIINKKISSGFESGIAQNTNYIFLGDIVGNFYAINKNDLTTVWQINTGAKIVVTPSLDLANVYFGNLDGKFYSVIYSSGKLNWSYKSEGIVNISPLVFNNVIILPDLYKYVYFLNKNSGEEIKRIDFDTRCRTVPMFYQNMIIFGVDKGNIFTYSVN